MHILFAAVPSDPDTDKSRFPCAKLVPVVLDFEFGNEKLVMLKREFDSIDEAERFVDGFHLAEFAAENGGFKAFRDLAEENEAVKTVDKDSDSLSGDFLRQNEGRADDPDFGTNLE